MDTSREALVREAFAAVIRAEMARRNMKNREMADRAGLSIGSVSNYLRGERDLRLPQFMAVAAALEIEPADLWDLAMAELRRLERGSPSSGM